jgi:anti-sigma regulatory factor (Ser/Thr protein kinase)
MGEGMSAGDRLELPLACGREASPCARGHVGAFLEAHDINSEVRQVALLIVSELVTNAVVHAAEPISLDVAIHDDTLRLEVCDGDDRAGAVAVRSAHGGDTNGRGLAIVESLAQRWGVRSHRGGKSVWAEMETSHASSHAGFRNGPGAH